MKNHRVEITDTTLRDAHQSLWATRMRTEDMIPIAETLDEVGYHSLEVWGGATFDVCLRYLNEDPWERLRTLKKYFKKTKLQMLLRGQSLVGYQHYPDDVVKAFCHKAVENGIDIIRIFDALNDIRNLEVSMKEAKAAGAHVQAAVSYTISPVHTLDHYLETAVALKELGADSICIKDMAGLLSPYAAYELVKMIKERLDIQVQLHCHYIGGMAVGAYLKGVEAGADVIDTASVPLAFGASQPPVETVARALKESPYDTSLDIHLLFEVAKYFEDLRKKNGFERGVTRITDMRVFDHQVPGGMISNLVSQLEEQNALDKIHDVLEEIPRVREDLGFPPLVTPTSQIVGTQAVLNVLTKERYKLVPGEVKAYAKGLYGKPVKPIGDEILDKILGEGKKDIIKCRPADILEPKMDKIRKEVEGIAESEEDVLSYALFPQVALKYFDWRKNQDVVDDEEDIPEEELEVPVPGQKQSKKGFSDVPKEDVNVNLTEIKELIKMLDATEITEIQLESAGVKVAIKKGGTFAQNAAEAPKVESKVVVEESTPVAKEEIVEDKSHLIPITAPMVGTFYRKPAPDADSFVELGQSVKEGQPVCIIEAMKLMNEIESEVSGKIVEVCVEDAQAVEYGQTLFLVEKE